MVKQLEGLRGYLDYDMVKSLAYLVQAQKTLEGYAETTPPPDSAPAPSSEPQPESQS
jgi:hypothetical protein